MTAGEIAGVIGAAVGTVVVVGFAVAFVGLLRTLRTLVGAIEALRAEVVPLAGQWRRTVDQANAELTRVDGLLDTAESVSGTVDSVSRLTYLTFSNPMIKFLALATGTGRAVRRFRRRRARGERAGFKRLFWLMLGVGVGFGTSFWVTRFVRAAVANYSPERGSGNPAASLRH